VILGTGLKPLDRLDRFTVPMTIVSTGLLYHNAHLRNRFRTFVQRPLNDRLVMIKTALVFPLRKVTQCRREDCQSN